MDVWQLNLRHLRALAAIVRLRSITAAAPAVNLTQPAVTQALARLEALLELRLFERQPGGMVPTLAARMLAPRIEAAMAHIASPRVTMAQVRAMIAVSRQGSYVQASAATGLSEPSLHRAVKDLGLALGQTLIERRGRGLALTDFGRRLARRFRLARAELEAGLSELQAQGGRTTGRIAIGAMPLARARFLPHVVGAFHRSHPDMDFVIAEGSHAELIEPLRDGELDLLIGALRDPPPGDDVIQQPLFTDHPVILARPGHPLAGTDLDIAALAACSWVVAVPGTPLRTQWQRMFADAGITAPRVPIECGSVIMIRELMLGGDFLTLLSRDQVAVELEAGWLVQLCEAPSTLVRTIGMTTRADWVPTALQREFLALLTNPAD